MEPIYLSIQQKETGKRIKQLIYDNGYSVKDIQEIMGFENPQAVYKWLSGKSLPSLDNFLILSKVLHTSIEDILVVDGDIVAYKENALLMNMKSLQSVLFRNWTERRQTYEKFMGLIYTFI